MLLRSICEKFLNENHCLLLSFGCCNHFGLPKMITLTGFYCSTKSWSIFCMWNLVVETVMRTFATKWSSSSIGNGLFQFCCEEEERFSQQLALSSKRYTNPVWRHARRFQFKKNITSLFENWKRVDVQNLNRPRRMILLESRDRWNLSFNSLFALPDICKLCSGEGVREGW